MSSITIDKWTNYDPRNKNLEELAIILSAIIDYINDLDERITALGG